MAKVDAKSGKLSAKEAGKRLKAARVLRDKPSAKGLAIELADRYSGIKWSRLARIERGKAQLEDLYIGKLAEALELPEAWFTEPLETLFSGTESPDDRITRIEEALVRIEGKLDRPDPFRHLDPAPPEAPPGNDESDPSRQTPPEEEGHSGEERP